MAANRTPQRIRGTQDIFGDEQARFTHVVETFERVRKLYGFRRVELPVFEATAVFARSLGETTDVVSKEMYTFEDRGGDSVTLRPEFTAGIARAYVGNGWQQYAPLKLATHGPVFRYERPQKGRYRQFHQVDAEVLGAPEPLADVELLAFADQLIRELGIADGVTLKLNTLGDAATRDSWRAALIAHFEAHRGDLSDDSVRRLDTNPMRILDSKDAQDRPVADSAPGIDGFLSGDAADFFAAVTSGLDAAGVAWTRDARLVRGLDYYRHTAFEFVTDRLGAQGTVLAGGRYDGLVESLGGPPTPGVGWAAGIERLGMLLEKSQPSRTLTRTIELAFYADLPDLEVLPASREDQLASLIFAIDARRHNVSAITGFSGNPKKRYERAINHGIACGIASVGMHGEIQEIRVQNVMFSEAEFNTLGRQLTDLLGMGIPDIHRSSSGPFAMTWTRALP